MLNNIFNLPISSGYVAVNLIQRRQLVASLFGTRLSSALLYKSVVIFSSVFERFHGVSVLP